MSTQKARCDMAAHRMNLWTSENTALRSCPPPYKLYLQLSNVYQVKRLRMFLEETYTMGRPSLSWPWIPPRPPKISSGNSSFIAALRSNNSRHRRVFLSISRASETLKFLESHQILSIRLKILDIIPCPKKLQKYNANSGIFGIGRIDVNTPESNRWYLRVGVIWVCVSEGVRKVALVMVLRWGIQGNATIENWMHPQSFDGCPFNLREAFCQGTLRFRRVVAGLLLWRTVFCRWYFRRLWGFWRHFCVGDSSRGCFWTHGSY